MRCKRKPEIQDGGQQTVTRIFQPVYNVAARFKRVYPSFESPGIQRSYSLYCVMRAEVRNSRWRTHKPEILILQPVHNIAARFQRLYLCFQTQRIRISYFFILFDTSRSQNFKMAAHKPEVLIFQPLYNVAAKFQRQYPCF